MKKIVLYIFITLFGYSYSSAEYSIVSDSLKSVLVKISDKKQKLPILLQLAKELTFDNPKDAEKYADEALNIAKQYQLKKQEIDAMLYLSGVKQSYGNYTESLEYLQKCYSMYEKLKDTVGVANCYMNIGNVHTYSKAYQLAADYYLKALQIYTKRKEERRIASVYSNLANTYYTMGDLKKSKEYSQDALNLYNKYDNDQGRISTLINLGNIESDNHRLKEALNYYNQGYLISKRIKRNYEIGVIQYNKAGLHLDLKKYKESISEVKEAIEISKKISLRDLEMQCYSLLSEAYEKKGDYKSSLEYHKKYTELNDSIFAKSKTNEYLQLEESFQSEKKQKQIERQKAALRQRDAEVKNQTITIIALILVSSLIVVLSLLVTRFYVFKKKENKKLSELNATKDKFFSIIAHDLKNPFSAIMGSSQLLLENIDTMTREEYIQFLEIIQKSSEAAHKLLDDLLLWARTQTGRLSMEFEDIKAAEIVLECVNLLNNQALAKEIVINVEVKDGLSLFVDNFSINTVVRNLVSNAIKFTKPGGSVSLKAEQSDKMGRIDVIDNGVGIKPEDEAKLFRIDASINRKGTTGENGTGLGLILCKELVEKNNGYITLKSKLGKGSTFSVFLPLSKV